MLLRKAIEQMYQWSNDQTTRMLASAQKLAPVHLCMHRCGAGPIVCVHVRHKQRYLFQTDIGLWLPDYGAVQSTLGEADFCHARMCFFFTFCTDLTALKIKQLHLSIFQHFEALSNKVREDDWLWLAMIEPSGRMPLVDANRHSSWGVSLSTSASRRVVWA